jgi:hypothetical protein
VRRPLRVLEGVGAALPAARDVQGVAEL